MSVYKAGERVRKVPCLKGMVIRMLALLLIFGLLYGSVWLGKGTVRHTADYGIQDACLKLYEAMKGLGTNESVIIDVVAAHTVMERQRLKKKYQVKYGKDLVKELDSEISFSFGKFVLALMMDPTEFVLDCINKCICSVSGKKKTGRLFKRVSSIFKTGLRGNEHLLIGMLCTKSNADLKAIKKAYKKQFGEDLEEKMAADGKRIPNDVCSFILDMIGGERDEELELDEELVSEDAQDLNTSKNEDALHQILQERSFPHLKRVFDEFMNVSGKTVDCLIEEWSGEISEEMQGAYKAVVSLIIDGEPAYWAERVQNSVEGAGTDDDTLIKVIVLRAEVDMLDIMDAYEKKFNISMLTEVGNDLSGDYKNLMLKILAKPPPEKRVKNANVSKEENSVTEEIVPAENKTSTEAAPPPDNEETEAEEVVAVEEEVVVETNNNQTEATPVEVIETELEETLDKNDNVTEESLEETIVEEVPEETTISDIQEDTTSQDVPEEESTVVEEVKKPTTVEDILKLVAIDDHEPEEATEEAPEVDRKDSVGEAIITPDEKEAASQDAEDIKNKNVTETAE